MLFVGVVVAAYAIIKFIIDSRRKGGGDPRSLTVLLLIAGILAAPALFIPLLLVIADLLLAVLVAILGLAGVTA